MKNDRRGSGRTHRAKMAKRKAVQDAEVAGKTVAEKGLLIVNTGPGKGKTTAAFGLALRMLGYGKRVGVVQFVKGAWHTGEKDAFAAFGDRVVWHTMGEGFTWETQDVKRDIAAAEAAWAKALELMADPTISLVVLDELNIALRYDYLDLDARGRGAEGAAARPACRGDRPQRQAGADRGGRSRHRDGRGEAPFRRRREGAAGHRVLEVLWRLQAAYRSTNSRAAKPEQADQQHVGQPEQLQRPPDVGGGGDAPAAFAHEGIPDHAAGIDARAGECQAERAGHRRFRPAGIGRAVLAGIAQHRLPGSAGIGAGRQGGGGNEQKGGEPRGRQVDQVVEARGGPAEGLVASACRWPIIELAVLTAL